MSSILLQTFNHYLGLDYSAAQATEYLRGMRVLPLPERISLNDWRVHVPMPMLEAWSTLTAVERVAIFVMAQSATHPYDSFTPADEPGVN